MIFLAVSTKPAKYIATPPWRLDRNSAVSSLRSNRLPRHRRNDCIIGGFAARLTSHRARLFQINLRLILVSGQSREYLFDASDSAGDIAQFVFDTWPEGKSGEYLFDASDSAGDIASSSSTPGQRVSPGSICLMPATRHATLPSLSSTPGERVSLTCDACSVTGLRSFGTCFVTLSRARDDYCGGGIMSCFECELM